MNILVLGANGQLGSELQLCIKESNQCQSNDTFNLFLKDQNTLDITRLQDLIDCANQLRPDVIINCAAIANADLCEKEPDLCFSVNAIGARNAAIAAQIIGAKLVHVSTDYVFDGNTSSPYKEYDACSPINIYGKSKLLSEEYVQSLCSKYFIVRTAWLYGRKGNNFIKTMLSMADQGKQIRVVNDQIGTPTNAKDLSQHIFRLLSTQEYGIYHCTNSGACSWYDFACAIFHESNIAQTVTPCSSEEYATLARRPAYSVLDNTMLRLTIGDKMRHWQDALADFIQMQQEV